MGNLYNIDSYLLDPKETKEVHPFINTSDLVASLYIPNDGTADPAGTCLAYTRAGAKYGGKVG